MRIALALGLLATLCSCLGPPPSHALVVRNLELKCALIAFSGCAAFADEEREPDAGIDAADGGVD
jgi:hypothetical protein